MNTEKSLFNFIREVVKSGGGVEVHFYDGGEYITASIESAYFKIPKEEKEVEVMDLKDVVQKYYGTKKEEGASA